MKKESRIRAILSFYYADRKGGGMLSVQYQRIELPMGGLMALKKMRVYFAHLQRDEQKIDGLLLTGVSALLLPVFFFNFHVCLRGIRRHIKSPPKRTFFFISTFYNRYVGLDFPLIAYNGGGRTAANIKIGSLHFAVHFKAGHRFFGKRVFAFSFQIDFQDQRFSDSVQGESAFQFIVVSAHFFKGSALETEGWEFVGVKEVRSLQMLIALFALRVNARDIGRKRYLGV